MNPSVQYALLKHIGIAGIEQAILRDIADKLEKSGYIVNCVEDIWTYDIEYIIFSCPKFHAKVCVDFVGQIIKLDALSWTLGLNNVDHYRFFDIFSSLNEYMNDLLIINSTKNCLLHFENNIDLKSEGLYNFCDKVEDFAFLIDSVSKELEIRDVFLNFLNENDLNELKYGE